MREVPYRKALVEQQFFTKIKHLTTNDTFSHGDMMSTVESSFDFETGTTETESEVVALAVHHAIFFVENLEVVEFTDNKNNLVLEDSANPPLGFTYFMLRSKVNRSAADKHNPDIYLVLRLQQTLVPSSGPVTLMVAVNTPTQSITPTRVDENIESLAQEVRN